MAHTTGPHTRGYVVIKEDQTGVWILCCDGCWTSLKGAQDGHKPMASTVRLCRYMEEAHRYARRHTFASRQIHIGGRQIGTMYERPRVISARAAGVPQEVCQ